MKRCNTSRIGLFTAILSVLFLLSGCNTTKQYNKALNIVRGDTDKFRNACEVAFPRIPIRIIEGKEVIKYDTITKPGDSIPCPKPTKSNQNPKVVCPPSTHTKETISKTDTIEVESSSYISELISKIQKADQDIEWWKNSTEECQSKTQQLNDKIIVLIEDNSALRLYKYFGWSAFTLLLIINGFYIYLKSKL